MFSLCSFNGTNNLWENDMNGFWILIQCECHPYTFNMFNVIHELLINVKYSHFVCSNDKLDVIDDMDY